MASLELRGKGASKIWHIRYRNRRGQSKSITTKLHTSPKNDILAQKKLIAFEVDLQRGKYPKDAIKIGKLLDDVIADYTVNAKKDLEMLKSRIEKHLRPWFGELRADQFAADDWREYVTHRLSGTLRKADCSSGTTEGRSGLTSRHLPQTGAANATINRERAILRRAFSLAYQAERIDKIPAIPRLKESAPRQGFIDRKQLESLCRHLPAYLSTAARFAFLTGWRLGEIRGLQWRHIDFERGEIRLDPGTTKNGEARVFPMTSELKALLTLARGEANPAEQEPRPARIQVAMATPTMATLTNFVFHMPNGDPIGWIYAAWKRACKAIGKPGLLFHDLRRSAVRSFIKSGMSQKLAMTLTGHKSDHIFRRYQIIDESDLERARELMERGEIRAQKSENG